ncbi:unnamed protein product [marine sediment metagenome]|uniref:Cyclin-like domain-containing protein n=1 Tax=marine sediment metagenome TaxID=412755 RepID=X1E6A0_9ZZZZ
MESYESPYANEILKKYFSLERSGMLADKDMFKNQEDINARMRGILFDWINEVSSMFKLQLKTLILSFTYMDIFIQRKYISRENLQGYGIVCLHLAAKMTEVYTPAIKDYVYVSDGNI